MHWFNIGRRASNSIFDFPSKAVFLLLALIGICSTAFSVTDFPANPVGRVPRDSDPTPNTITLDAGPRVIKGANVFFMADFTYWYARQEGLGFSQSGYLSEGFGPKTGRVQDLDFGYTPGFKVGAGLNLREDGWDALAQYTWSYHKASRSRSARKTGSLHPTWFILDQYNINTDLLNARGNWDLHFNVVDIEFGRNFFVSKYAALRPFVGFKGTWQKQDYHVRYVREDSQRANMFIDEEYWAIGGRFGLNTSWFINPTWSIYGDGAVSLLWGQFKITRKDSLSENLTAPFDVVMDLVNDFHSIKGVVEFGAGLRFDDWTYDYRYHFRLQIGWEQQIWLSHNQYVRTFEECAHGDLIFQGVVIKGRFDF